MKTASEPSSPGQRRKRRGSQLVALDLLEAALVEFAAHGFEGASTRAIAERAGAHQPQINYHFASKEQLWHAAVDHLFGLLTAELGSGAPSGSPGQDPIDAFADAIRRFVRFSAARPELHRIMNLESTADSARLAWIVQRHVQPRFDALELAWRELRATGQGADLTALEVWQLLIGFGALPYANAPLLVHLTPFDPADADVVEAHASRLVSLLLPAPAPGRRRRDRSR